MRWIMTGSCLRKGEVLIAAGGAFDGMHLRRVAFPGYSFLSPTGNFGENVPPAAHFSHQLEKWAKEPFETDGFKTSFALKSCVRYGL